MTTEIILIGTFVINSVLIVTKNIRHFQTICGKMCTCVCTQEPDDSQDVHDIIKQMHEGLEKIKSKTPRGSRAPTTDTQ